MSDVLGADSDIVAGSPTVPEGEMTWIVRVKGEVGIALPYVIVTSCDVVAAGRVSCQNPETVVPELAAGTNASNGSLSAEVAPPPFTATTSAPYGEPAET